MQIANWLIVVIVLLLILGLGFVIGIYNEFKEFMDTFRDYDEDMDYPYYEMDPDWNL